MSGTTLGLVAFGILLLMLVVRIHIGVAMFLAATGIYMVLNHGELNALLFTLNNLVYARLSNYDLAVIPLFILMGQFATHGGLSKALFHAAGTLIGHFRGGLAYAATAACAAFGAICGSSLATAATMGQVALPELTRRNYSGRLATGTLAAGGTLGILIPPSVPLVIYAVLTQESIGKLFVAAVIPGIVAALGYMAVIRIIVTFDPKAGPASERVSIKEMLKAQVGILPVLLVFLVVIVGIYGGWANPTEAASIGAAACGIIAVVSGGMRFKDLKQSIFGTAIATAMIFMVLIGADLLNSALALTQMPTELANWVKNSGMPPVGVLFTIIAIYVLLGCVMDSLAMILLTIPIFYPVVLGLDFYGMSIEDKSIWFGIVALMVVEIGLVHPPVGMNLYVINKIAKDVPLKETAMGVLPFLASDFIRILVLVFFPPLALWLVHVTG
ncbi:TRAP dicarboxylate transporter DctM subunit unknown substrate 3 [Paramagnetospirillum magnetotacticum MS-1]|uniref:TRAP transporter large permease protein n=1 Tax=Paramagnetospirillum magnetotacticum MS-1 TaxID=272627 RepID=A0A0C2YX02_PARME|nr:TRAP transporter large permease [Paramagnetospirillum magnetotacticum]KIL99215.1 TRAP dicarboxylate transporter DctM subunit unknown substrate 3 [Paramagnetospirillum magnetotacticum MS-1]